jgi:iron(II)-dependent oxidoreductase
VNTEALLKELGQTQSLLLALAEQADEATLRSQYHPDLSPLGWHLGHCVFIECLWLHEEVRGDNSVTQPITDFYTPPRTPKPERGKRLPPKDIFLNWARELQAFNLHYLRNLRPEWRGHPLFQDDYILHFLVQHNSQHYETMLMVLTQKALTEHQANAEALQGLQGLQAQAPTPEPVEVPAGHYRVGGRRPSAYDNEVPPQRAELGPFAISRHPVSNAEYLAFIEDGGYQRKELWGEDGWNWCRGARLPHEYQWEAACRLALLEQTGRVWEWCDNTFHPYLGFTPFPYPEYSQPWFDEQHYSLRGGSIHTRPVIKRPSFRNFFTPDKRHIFAGLRLVF